MSRRNVILAAVGLLAVGVAIGQCGQAPDRFPPVPPQVTTSVPVPTTLPPVTTVQPTPELPEPTDVEPLPAVGDSENLPDGALTGGYCARKWWC